jgi:hypothetical protein
MEINEEVSEIIGVLIGDGYIYMKNKKYQIGFVGNPKTDREMFEHLKELIFKEWNKDTEIKLRERGLRLVFNSKDICLFLTKDLGIPFGEGKCEKVVIPKIILDNWQFARCTIRGIMDSDGSVFASKKPGIERYPSMEITTTSLRLANQLRDILLERGFRVTKIRSALSKTSKRIAYRVCLYGKENIRKWLNEIGFSNLYKKNRALNYLQ